MQNKKIVKSKTVWLNSLVVLSSVGVMLLEDEAFKNLVGANIGIIGTVIGGLGLVLRFYTHEPISAKKVWDDALNEEDY